MTTKDSTRIPTNNTRSIVNSWPSLAVGDDGAPVSFCQYTDKSVQVVGTFGVGGTLRLEGSNNGSDWAVLTDPQGNDLNITSEKIEMITEATLFVRPRVTGGDGTTLLNVYLLMKE